MGAGVAFRGCVGVVAMGLQSPGPPACASLRTEPMPAAPSSVPGARRSASGSNSPPSSPATPCRLLSKGIFRERCDASPCITVGDTIDRVLIPHRLSGLRSDRWPGRHHLPRVAVRGKGQLPPKNFSHRDKLLKSLCEGQEVFRSVPCGGGQGAGGQGPLRGL